MGFDSTSIQSASITVSRYSENHSLNLTLKAGANDIVAGQLVKISADNTVDYVTAGTDVPIGVAKTSRATTKKLAVQTFFCRDLKAIAKGGALAAGAFVKPNGNVDANGRPEVVAVALSDYSAMIVLEGGALDDEIRLGVFRAPIQTPSA